MIRHNAAALLSCERVILNLMQRMSGIATLTNEFVKAVAGTKTKVLDTRKTIPGLRALDKYAVCCGGGVNHRLDLQDGILIKNNHISLGGGLPAVLEKALKGRKTGQMVQVEVRTPDGAGAGDCGWRGVDSAGQHDAGAGEEGGEADSRGAAEAFRLRPRAT